MCVCWGQFLKHMIHNGVLQDHSVLQKRLSNVLGATTTFVEAFAKTGAHPSLYSVQDGTHTVHLV